MHACCFNSRFDQRNLWLANGKKNEHFVALLLVLLTDQYWSHRGGCAVKISNHCSQELCAYHCHIPPTPGWAQVEIIWDLQESFDKFPTPGDNLCCKPPTFCTEIPQTMKIPGQMPQPWGQMMLTNRYKSPTHCPTWGRWELKMIGAFKYY